MTRDLETPCVTMRTPKEWAEAKDTLPSTHEHFAAVVKAFETAKPAVAARKAEPMAYDMARASNEVECHFQ